MAEAGAGVTLPLAGLRILSSEQYGAGPYGTMFLAQLGAEVIKLEPPRGGDSARATGPYFLGADDSLFFQTFNLNKRSITVDLTTDGGQELLHRLAATAHAVTNNSRGDLPERLGLTYDRLKAANPRIACVHASAYGRTGPKAGWPGYDYLMQAEAGWMSVTGEPDAPPTRFGLSLVDFITGSMLATTTLAAIRDAEVNGIGRDFDLSLLDAALHQTSYPAFWYLNEGHVTERAPRSAHPYVTPSQTFRTADGWIFVMAQLPKFWTRLTEAIERPDLVSDERFATPAARLQNRDELTRELDAVFLRATSAEWMQRLGGTVPVAPVRTMADALSPEVAGDLLGEVDHPERSGMKVLANPVRVAGERLPNRAGPSLGADTEALLAELGYGFNEVAALRRDGAI
jgi:crotonobetainyl-CoA:carnitine CoA-transferase CaiB-like acyl-CoA transferase